jgi:hypothetical protein
MAILPSVSGNARLISDRVLPDVEWATLPSLCLAISTAHSSLTISTAAFMHIGASRAALSDPANRRHARFLASAVMRKSHNTADTDRAAPSEWPSVPRSMLADGERAFA